jgi:hypothetical protein
MEIARIAMTTSFDIMEHEDSACHHIIALRGVDGDRLAVDKFSRAVRPRSLLSCRPPYTTTYTILAPVVGRRRNDLVSDDMKVNKIGRKTNFQEVANRVRAWR